MRSSRYASMHMQTLLRRTACAASISKYIEARGAPHFLMHNAIDVRMNEVVTSRFAPSGFARQKKNRSEKSMLENTHIQCSYFPEPLSRLVGWGGGGSTISQTTPEVHF